MVSCGAVRYDFGTKDIDGSSPRELADGVTTSEALTMRSKEYFLRQAGSLIPGDVAVDIETTADYLLERRLVSLTGERRLDGV